MNRKIKIQIFVCLLIGAIFLFVGAYQWYDLHQAEQGLKQGQLSIVLLKIYEIAGKWGVAGFYSLFSIYCFWRSAHLYKLAKQHKQFDDGSYSTYEQEDEE